jgi:uncharacterized protein YbjQ (UPF0145 family)
MPGIIVTTGNDVVGYRIAEYLGIVRGIVVRSPTIGQGFLGGLKRIVGGNIESYTEACEQARREAFKRMIVHAQDMEADAIIAMRLRRHRIRPGHDGSARLRHRRPPGPKWRRGRRWRRRANHDERLGMRREW